MRLPLKITKNIITVDESTPKVLDMTGSCAFAVCLYGDIDVRILNREYKICSHSVVLCLPFVNVELVKVNATSEVVLGGIALEDVLSIVNLTVATNNLLAIRQHPIVCANTEQFNYIKTSVEEYIRDTDEAESVQGEPYRQIHQEIIKSRICLIVAQILKLYFTNMPMAVQGRHHHDIIFQNFMLDLYDNFMNNHSVKFYAKRSGLSIKYFSTIVRKISGTGPSEWIDMVVVGEAKALLLNPQCNIKEIAAQLNFPDASTFSKFFVRLTGMSPRAYRRSICL